MSRIGPAALFLLAFLLVSPAFAVINSYNVTSDFSDANNPNGVWAYRQGTVALPHQSGVCCGGAGVGPAWAPGTTTTTFLPMVLRATGPTGNPNDFVAGDVVVYSVDQTAGVPANGEANITWTAPSAGVVNFSGSVWYAHALQYRSNDFSLRYNSQTTALASGTVSAANGRNRSNPVPFSGALWMNAGDVLTLQVSRSAGQFFGSYAGVRWTVTQVPGFQPYARDFRGIFRSDVFVYDPAGGAGYAGLSNGDGTYQFVGAAYTTGFNILRSGDFNGDGKADMVVYRSSDGLGYMGLGLGNGQFNYQSLFWSPGYNIVETGDFNADGRTDFLLYRASDGTTYFAVSGTSGYTYKYLLASIGYTHARVADFNGDGKADVFFYRASDGLGYIGFGNGDGTFNFSPLPTGPGYDEVLVGDLNNDGKADLVFYTRSNGALVTAISNGIGFNFGNQSYSPGFTAVRLADINGDGRSDLLMYNGNTAVGYFGIGDGLGNFTFGSVFWGSGMTNVEPQDLNGDGLADIVLYNSATGTAYAGVGDGTGNFNYKYSYWGIGRLLAK